MTKEKTLVSEKLAKALFVWIVLHAAAVFMNLRGDRMEWLAAAFAIYCVCTLWIDALSWKEKNPETVSMLACCWLVFSICMAAWVFYVHESWSGAGLEVLFAVPFAPLAGYELWNVRYTPSVGLISGVFQYLLLLLCIGHSAYYWYLSRRLKAGGRIDIWKKRGRAYGFLGL